MLIKGRLWLSGRRVRYEIRSWCVKLFSGCFGSAGFVLSPHPSPLLSEVHHWSPLLQFNTRSKAREGFVSEEQQFSDPPDKDFSAICNHRRVLQQKKSCMPTLVDADLLWMVVRLSRANQGISTTHFGLPAHHKVKRQKNHNKPSDSY